MKDREIDAILQQAGDASRGVDPALLNRIAGALGPAVPPVRPLPRNWVLAVGLLAVCTAVALAGAARLGFLGFQKLGVPGRALIFPALAVLTWISAAACVAEMIPGSRRRVPPGFLPGAASLALVAVFAGLFRDYHTDHFVQQGLICLTAGMLHAIPAALLCWLLLRRGFAVNPVAAGLVAGTLAGLAGISMLELHCQNFEAPHVMLWHTAVIPVSAGAGALAAWLRNLRR